MADKKTEATKQESKPAESVLAPIARELSDAISKVGGDIARRNAEQALALLNEAVQADS